MSQNSQIARTQLLNAWHRCECGHDRFIRFTAWRSGGPGYVYRCTACRYDVQMRPSVVQELGTNWDRYWPGRPSYRVAP